MGIFTSYLSEKEKNGGAPLTRAVEQPAAGTNDGTANSQGIFKDYLASQDSAQPKSAGAAPSEALAPAQKSNDYVPSAEVYGQGAGLGYGTQLNAGIQSAAGAADQALNGSNAFGDQSSDNASTMTRIVDAISNVPKNYSRAKKGINEQIDKARIENPIRSALLELTGSIAPSYLGGAALKGAGLLSSGGQAATIAGAYGYGSSRDEGIGRLQDAGKSAALGYGIAKASTLLGGVINEVKKIPFEEIAASEYANYGKPIFSLAKASVKETPYGLDFKPKMGDAFQIGKEMKAVLTDPNVQAQVTSEFNAQPHVVQQIIDMTKDRLGKTWEPILAEHGDIATASDPILNKAYETAKGVAVEGDDIAQKLQSALFNKITGFAESTRPTDKVMGTGGQVSLRQLTEAQEALGNAIYRDKQFQKAPGVEAAAKRIWGQIADEASKLDQTQGSGGQLKQINKVFKAMYGMEDNMIKGTDIRAMTNPQAVGAENRFEQFVKPFQDLPPNLRQELAPEMHSYLAESFPKVFAKAKTMVAATTGRDTSLISKVLSMAGLRSLKPINIANRAGQLSNLEYSGPNPDMSNLSDQFSKTDAARTVLAPSIASQMTTKPNP
jgi:hypothetical protein